MEKENENLKKLLIEYRDSTHDYLNYYLVFEQTKKGNLPTEDSIEISIGKLKRQTNASHTLLAAIKDLE